MGILKKNDENWDEEYENNKIPKPLIIIIAIIILIVAIYYLIWIKNNNWDKIDEEDKTQYEALFNKYNLDTFWLNYDDSYGTPEYFYQDNINKHTINDSVKFAISISNLYLKKEIYNSYYGEVYEYNILDFGNKKEIKIDEIDRKSEELFGSKININNILDENKNVNVIVEGYEFKYNPNGKYLTYEEFGMFNTEIKNLQTKITNVNKFNNRIEITSKAMFIVCNDEIDGCYAKKTVSDDEDNIIKKFGYDENVNIENYLRKLNSYKWTFIMNSYGNYVLESVEKIG